MSNDFGEIRMTVCSKKQFLKTNKWAKHNKMLIEQGRCNAAQSVEK